MATDADVDASPRSCLRVIHLAKFAAPTHGGMETYVRVLSERLAKAMAVEVVATGTQCSDSPEEPGRVRVRVVRSYGTIASSPIAPGYVTALRQSSADIVHLHHPNPMGTLAYLLAGRRRTLVITYHSDVVRQRFLRIALAAPLHLLLRRAVAIVVTSPNYLATSRTLRRFTDKCHVIPCGIELDTDRAERSSCTDHTHQAAQADQADHSDTAHTDTDHGREPTVLSIGRLVYYKGFDQLLHAMIGLKARLVIIGDGPEYEPLRATARRLGLDTKVTFLRSVEDIQPHLRAADVFVLPSIARSEAFGIVQLEAMAAGLPVVNTRLDSGVPYVSVDGVTGRTVTPGDPGELRSAICALLADPDLRHRYGDAGRARVAELFTGRAMAEAMRSLYLSIADQHRP